MIDTLVARYRESGLLDDAAYAAGRAQSLYRHGASLQAIRALGKKAGVTMNPATPVASVEHVIDLVDLILIMSVNPGFGGQTFIPAALDKLRDVRTLVGARPIDIEVDGGVTAQNAADVVRAGANVLVAGSAVFKGGNYKANIAAVRQAAALARGEAA